MNRRNSAALAFLWLGAACLFSVLSYGTLFAFVLDHPLDLGFLRQELESKLARGASADSPKLVILAGSNGPYSHRCEIMEPVLRLPCVNGGVAVGLGLDYLFARWQPLLRPGDMVYLPMEEAQYVRGRADTMTGPDAAIMLRHDRSTLAGLPPPRWFGALFSTGLPGALMAPLEMALVAAGYRVPRAAAVGGTNVWGDHVGHTEALAASSAGALRSATPWHASADAIRTGYGTLLIGQFLRWAGAHGVLAVGGLPTEFDDSPMPVEVADAIRDVFASHGAAFLEVGNHSRYPRSAFFDSPDHLNETWQLRHSATLALALQHYRPAEKQACVTPARQRLDAGAPTTRPRSREVPPCPPAPNPGSAPPAATACCPAG